MKTKTIPAIHHRLLALAVLLLALAPGRAAADPAAIFLSNAYTGTVPAYSATGAAATGYTVPAGFMYAEGVAYNPANNTLYCFFRVGWECGSLAACLSSNTM